MVEQKPSSAISDVKEIEVLLVENEYKNSLENNNAQHIKEFTIVTSPSLGMQRSFMNSEDGASDGDNKEDNAVPTSKASKMGMKREQKGKRDAIATFASGKPYGLNEEGDSDYEDEEDQQSLSDGCFGSSERNDSA